MKEKVLITGGSGLIGGNLTRLLQEEGYEVVHLSRSVNSKFGVKTYVWDIPNGTMDSSALVNVSYIVHLAGAGISDKPWSYKYRKEIVKSRIDGIPILLKAVQQQNSPLKAFISASGVNYYGSQSMDENISEDNTPGDDFLAKTCLYWENYADKFSDITRVVKFRTGIVLDSNKGAFPKISEPFKYGFGAVLGSGKQYMSWIHVDDICQMYLHAIQNSLVEGSYNACAPQATSNIQFSQTLSQVLKKKMWLPKIPSGVIKIIFGLMSDIILFGNHCPSDKIIKTGFKFKFTDLKAALNSLIK